MEFSNQISLFAWGLGLRERFDCTVSSCVPTDPAAFYNTPSQMALLANQLGGAILMAHSELSRFRPLPDVLTRFGLLPLYKCVSV